MNEDIDVCIARGPIRIPPGASLVTDAEEEVSSSIYYIIFRLSYSQKCYSYHIGIFIIHRFGS